MSQVPAKVHATLGASVAARWMACPGSVNLSEGLPNRESEAARAGTAAHAVAELCLKHNNEPAAYIGDIVEGVEVTEEMAEAVQVFVDHCRGIGAFADQTWIEHKFSLAELDPPAPMYGTCDFAAYIAEERALYICDLKYGSGHLVEATDNVQLRYYALGAALTLGNGLAIDEVVMTIVQPRMRHPEGVVRSDTICYVGLLEFAGELMDAARATQHPAAPLHAGPHCTFCPAKAICPEQLREAQAIALVEFDAMPLEGPPAPASLPPHIVGDLLTKLPQLEAWAKELKAHGQYLLEQGVEVPGQKLVARRPRRVWVDEAETARRLEAMGQSEDDIYKRELKSPAQIEKLVGKKNLPSDLWEKKSSGYTMAPVTDTRPEVALAAVTEFDALPSGDEQ